MKGKADKDLVCINQCINEDIKKYSQHNYTESGDILSLELFVSKVPCPDNEIVTQVGHY